MMCSGKIEPGFALMGSVLDTPGVSALACGTVCTIKGMIHRVLVHHTLLLGFLLLYAEYSQYVLSPC